MRGIGIDVGTGSVSLAVVEDRRLVWQAYRLHKGKVRETLEKMLEKAAELESRSGEPIRFAAASPAAARWLAASGIVLPREAEANRVSALLAGVRLLHPEAGSAAEIGAQTSCFVTGLSAGETVRYAVNGDCASGTGSFFEDQMYRLGLPLEAYSKLVRQARSVPRLAGRCSVFAKTDLIHRQQEGVPAADILLGLAFAVIRSFKGGVVRSLPVRTPLVLAGGVVKNEGVIRAVREVFGLAEGELIAEESGAVLSAAGLAALALEQGCGFDWKEGARPGENGRSRRGTEASKTEKTFLLPAFPYDREALHRTRALRPGEHPWLGVDVGSTSTNLALLGEDSEVLDFLYLRTAGDPEQAVRAGLEIWKEKYGDALSVRGIGVTGSGRVLIGKRFSDGTFSAFVQGDAAARVRVADEITAQACASAFFFPEADTIFEIGGQDSKFISLKNGQVTDFEMNKVCAAGTGSFIEEQAGRMDVPLSDIGPMALASRRPAELGERCTVLMNSRIAQALAENTPKEDICAGLCRSIVNNYLDRVAANRRIGDCICLQGGTMNNEGIVAAFYERFGKRLHITPYYDVTGACGAALLAGEASGERRADGTANAEIYGRDRKWFLAGYDGTLDGDKKTVGIPRALMIYKFFPMAYRYFTFLGFNVLLSPETDEEIIGLAQEVTQEETCYPVKLLHGHMEWLARRGVDYLFIPCVRTIRHEKSGVKHNYGCVYMQSAPRIVAETLRLEARGVTLLAPVLDLDMGRPQLAGAMIRTGMSLGFEKERCAECMKLGAAAMKQCEAQTEQLGQEIMENLGPDEKVLVLITRNYGISDRILNMGIPQELLKRGCRVLTLQHLQGHSVDLTAEFPNVYWPFGQHILSGAKIIKENPNLYAVYLTNHGCGPDTMLAHLFGEIMGDKPYLAIEVDEHQSAVGVITRIEAFLNSLEHVPAASGTGDTDNHMEENRKSGGAVLETGNPEKFPADAELLFPPLGIYTRLLASDLRAQGRRARALPDYTAEDLAAGKAESISKEACTFSGELGQILRLLRGESAACGASGTAAPGVDGQPVFLIPQTEGAETEGAYARVIRSVLERRLRLSVSGANGAYENHAVRPETMLFAPYVEDLAVQPAGGRIWNLLLAGDALNLLTETEQERLAAQCDLEGAGVLRLQSEEGLREFLQSCHALFLKHPHASDVFLCGSPALLMSAYLNRGLFAAVRAHGKCPVPMPLAEYLWFWLREAGRELPAEWTRKLEDFRALYADVYGTRQTLADAWERLTRRVPPVTGANLRYLYEFCAQERPDCAGVILLTPAYANSGSVLELLNVGAGRRFLHYEPEGSGEADEIERREIFLNLLDA